MRKALKILSYTGFFLYAVLMLWLLFGQRLGYAFEGAYWEKLAANINLMPFKTVTGYVADLFSDVSFGEFRHAVINLVGNVIMFVPLGFLLPCVVRRMRSFLRHFAYCAVLIVFIELIQLFTLLGSLDIDDLLLNLIGTTVGYLIFKAVNTAANKRLES